MLLFDTFGQMRQISHRAFDLAPGAFEVVAAHHDAFAASLLGKLSLRTNPFPAELIEGADLLLEVMKMPENIATLSAFPPIRRVLAIPSVRALLQNQEIRAFAEKQDMFGLLRHPAVKSVLEDPAVQEALKRIDPEELRKFLKQK